MTTTQFPTIFAQTDILRLDNAVPALIAITLLVGMLLIGGYASVAAVKLSRRSRDQLHEERMKAIESGLNWQDPSQKEQQDKVVHNAFWVSFWMVVVGCGGSFLAVSRFLDSGTEYDTNVAIVAWLSAGAASIAALSCATLLTVKTRAQIEQSGNGGKR